ncbi:MAG: hypothetical protein WC915_05250 [archaeon]|jgi:hypothetical protein
MNKQVITFLIATTALILIAGCINSFTIIGSWSTDSIIGEQTINFETNGTGVIDSSIGNLAFDYEVIDHNTIKFDPKKALFGFEIGPRIVSYELVNQNTLIFGGTTYTRVQ